MVMKGRQDGTADDGDQPLDEERKSHPRSAHATVFDHLEWRGHSASVGGLLQIAASAGRYWLFADVGLIEISEESHQGKAITVEPGSGNF